MIGYFTGRSWWGSTFNPHCWKNNKIDKLYNDDTLWAYIIWASEEFCLQDWDRVHNLVLCQLLSMGIFNWEGVDKTLNWMVLVMCYSTAVSTYLLNHLLKVNEKVGCYWPCLLVPKLTTTLVV